MSEHTWHVRNPEEMRRRLAELPGVLSGRLPDRTGAVRSVQCAAGVALLGRVQDNYVRCSEGGVNELTGEPWADLSPVTLALRRKDAAPAKVAKLVERLKGLPAHRQRLIGTQYAKLLAVYTADEQTPSAGRKARRYAKALVDTLERHRLITAGRAKALRSELKPQRQERAQRLATAGAFALILRDAGLLLAALTPVVGQTGPVAPGQVFETGPGFVAVGAAGRLGEILRYHTSGRPRRLKKDGTPRLPRRQVLPEPGRLPPAWKEAVTAVVREGLRSRAFWDAYLSA